MTKEGLGPCFGDCLHIGPHPETLTSSYILEGRTYKVALRKGKTPCRFKLAFRVADY